MSIRDYQKIKKEIGDSNLVFDSGDPGMFFRFTSALLLSYMFYVFLY